MEEIQSQPDNYRSSSSSASSPAGRVLSSDYFYLRKPGSVRQPISFEDSPEWGDTNVDTRAELRGCGCGCGDSINAATSPASPSLSKMNSASLPSPLATEGVAVSRKVVGASVVWKDLTVTISGKRRYSDRIVKSSNVYALLGTMTVIMGPAKSGKSTLLTYIAGRLPNSAMMFGEVFVNGGKGRMPYGSYGFVERETALIGSLTVQGYLYYLVLLQLLGFFCQKRSVVKDAILAMSLSDYGNKLIGGHCYMKGLPRGERRRVTVARELVMRPHILFIDEPLYHLDRILTSFKWKYVVLRGDIGLLTASGLFIIKRAHSKSFPKVEDAPGMSDRAAPHQSKCVNKQKKRSGGQTNSPTMGKRHPNSRWISTIRKFESLSLFSPVMRTSSIIRSTAGSPSLNMPRASPARRKPTTANTPKKEKNEADKI